MLMSFWVGDSCGVGRHREVLAGVPAPLGGDVLVPVAEAVAEVVPGAERAPGAADDDHLDLSVARGGRDRVLHLVGHRRHDRVERLGPVQREPRNRSVDGVGDRAVGHRRLHFGSIGRSAYDRLMTLASEVIARRMGLARPLTHDVTQQADLRVTMDDGTVLLADRWVATESAERPQPTVLVRSPYGRRVHRTAVRTAAGRAGAAGGDPERPRHVRIGGRIQPVRRARGRAGHVAMAPRAAVARRPDRDARAELPRPGAVGGRARRGRGSRRALDPGQRLAVPRPDLRRRQPVA